MERLPATATNPSAGFSPYALAVADFNGDGTSDLAVTNGGFGTTFSILTSQLTQTATATVTGISATGTGSQLVTPATQGTATTKPAVSATTALKHRTGHAHGDGRSILVQHHDSAIRSGDRHGQRRIRQPSADRLGDAEQRRLHVGSQDTGRGLGDDQRPGWIVGRG